MAQEKFKRFSDVYPKAPLFEGEQIDISEVLGKEILIRDVAELSGQFGEYVIVLADSEKRVVSFSVGSRVITPKLLKAKKEGSFPLLAKIAEHKGKKTGQTYYDIE